MSPADLKIVGFGLEQMRQAVLFGLCRKCDCLICTGMRLGFKMADDESRAS